MIEKLKPLEGLDHSWLNKINELVDAVNSIVSVQEKLIDSRFVVETKHKEPADNSEKANMVWILNKGGDNE